MTREDITLRVADLLTLDVSLALGALNQEVTVKESAPPLDTASASLGQVVDHKHLDDVPFREGNPYEFIKLAPGVATQTQLRLDKPGMTGGLSQVSVDGSGQYRSEFQFDGVANVSGQAVAYSPPAAAVQEMKVETATYDASRGYTAGGVFNVVSRGGTNQYHGEGWLAYRNSRFDSKDFFTALNHTSKPQYTDTRYGGAFGGPVKHDKLFFFGAVEFNPYQNPFVFQRTMPTAQMRTGNLTELNSFGQVYDPLSGRVDPTNAGRVVRDPFPSNILPASRLNPASLKLINVYPLPNLPGISQNFQHPDPVEEHHWYTGTSRVDYAISDKNRAFMRYSDARWVYADPDFFLNHLGSGNTTDRVQRLFAIDDTHTFSPSLVLNARFGLTFSHDINDSFSSGVDLNGYGLGAIQKLSSTPDRLILPSITINGYTGYRASIGAGASDNTDNRVYTAAGTFNYIKGSHMLAFGAESRIYTQTFFDDYGARAPSYTFGSSWTVGPFNTSAGVDQLHALAAFLLGYPGSGSMSVVPTRVERTPNTAVFIQDNWRVTPRLTLNLGLRYELELPTRESQNRTVTGLDLTTSLPIEAAVVAKYAQSPVPEVPVSNFHVRGGMLYAGVGGQTTSLWQTRRTNFMPRIGVAYQLDKKTVLRGGYGRFYDSLGITRIHSVQTGYSQATSIQTTVDGIVPRADAFANPFPSGLLPPVGNTLGLMENVGNSISAALAAGATTPYSERFSVGLQRQLPLGFVVDSTYIASRGHDLFVNRQLDNMSAQYLSKSLIRDQAIIDFLNARFSNPFFGVLSSGTSLGGSSSLSRSQFLVPYPQFTGISYNETTGRSWYDAMQLRVERRLSAGVTVNLAYSFSKSQQQTDFRNASEITPEKRLSDNDRTHVLAVNGLMELPFGRNRRWGSGWNAPLNHLLGNWQLSMIYRMESGYPFPFGNFVLKPGTTFAGLALPSSQRSWQHEFNTAAFDIVPADQPSSNIRYYSSRAGTVRFEGFDTFDAILMKSIVIHERVNAQFRVECYNLLNTANLDGLNSSTSSPSFGTVTGVNGYARQLQFGLRVRF